MDFNYVDFLSSSDKDLIEKLYYESFDKDERFPFWLLKKCCKENNVKFNVIYSKDKVIGFQYIIEYDNIAYLMYFAIEKNQRNNGYGSEILKELNRSYKNVLLCIEKTNEQVMELYDKLKEDIPELDINIMQDSFADRKWIETIKNVVLNIKL